MGMGLSSCVAIRFACGALLAAALPVIASETRYVWQGSPSPTPPHLTWATAAHTIQEAVDVSLEGDVVVVTNGVYSTGGRKVLGGLTINRVAIDRPITVRSAAGPEFTAIEGAPPPDPGEAEGATRCVYLGTNAMLIGFTLTNGFADAAGGGLWSELYSVADQCWITGCFAVSDGGGAYGGTLMNCVVTNNTAEFGGGLTQCVASNCVLAANLASRGTGGGAVFSLLIGCILQDNFASVGGGAASCTLEQCILTNNIVTGLGGGAIESTVNECTLRGNYADFGGGTANSTVMRSEFTGNSAGYGGGAWMGTLQNCSLTGNIGRSYGGGSSRSTLENCSLTGNTAAQEGGGAFTGTLRTCLLTGNRAGQFGGGVSAAVLINCTVVSNTAVVRGGGVAGTTADNCIVFGNAAPQGPNHSMLSAMNYSCTTPLPDGGMGNIDLEPRFVDAGAGNYRLSVNSPCIDAGANDGWMSSAIDLAGALRLVNDTVDMGAYEYTHLIPIEPSILEQPRSGRYLLGSSVRLGIVCRGTLPLTYQWYHGTERIAGANARTLEFQLASSSQFGDYFVQVSNAAKSLNSSNAVISANSPPVARPDTATTTEGVAITFNVLANDTDADGDQLQVLFAPLSHSFPGLVTLSPTGDLTYVPPADFVGVVRFEYIVSDGFPGGTNAATITVVVEARPAPSCQPQFWPPERGMFFPDSPALYLISIDHEEACLVLSGGGLDPRDGPVQIHWTWDNTNSAAVDMLTNCFALGPHSVTLAVSNGRSACTVSFEMHVITPAEAIERCTELVEEVKVDRKNKRPLLASLQAATESFQEDDVLSGLHQLAAFQAKVRAQLGRRYPTEAQTLLNFAGGVSASISSALP